MKRLAVGVLLAGAAAGIGLAPRAALAEPSRIERLAEFLREPKNDSKVGSVEISGDRQTLEARDIRITPNGGAEAISIRSLQFYDMDWDGEPAPRHGRVRAREIVIPIRDGDENTRRLREAGYESLVIDADFHFDFDEQREKLNVDMRVDAREMGLLTAEAEAHGVSGRFWAALANGYAEAGNTPEIGELGRNVAVERVSLRYDGPSRRLAALLPVSVQSVTVDVSGVDEKSVVPRRARLAARGLAVDMSQGGHADTQAALKDLGYDSVQANLDYQCSYDERLQKLEAMLNIDLPEMGGVRYEVELGGLGALVALASSKAMWEKGVSGADALGMSALAMTLNRASLRYEDHSLTERIVASVARKRGVTEEEARAKLLNDIQERRGEVAENTAKMALDAAAAFIQKPGAIGVSLRPESPASFVELAALALSGDYDALTRRLGLQVDSR